MAGSHPQISQPMSVKEITIKAEDFEFNASVPFKFWLRTADTLLREASIYEQEHNDQQAYLLLMRYATLVTAKLPSHPSARDPEHRQGLNASIRTVSGVVERLAVLKPRINARYENYQRALERRKQASEALESNGTHSQSYMGLATSDPAVAGNITTLGAAENSALAVKLAHSEIRRRDAAKRSTRQAGVSEKQEHERRIAGIWEDWEAALSQDGRSRGEKSREDEEMRRDMEASRQRLDGNHDSTIDRGRRTFSKRAPLSARPNQERSGSSEYRYPSIPKSQPPRQNEPAVSTQHALPPKPPKEEIERPDQTPRYLPQPPPSIPEKRAVEPQLEYEPETKPPESFTFRPAAYLENGKPLRTVFLPPTLRDQFLTYAAPNTARNLETCGVLCGTLISNALFISRVVIPEQISTSDTCETVDEVALFEYCSKEDLMVLGWIHTHPTQTCFMSSRDLHTHFGYQTMISESIAVVCAPSKTPSWGIFRLTDPPGMTCVLQCTNTGIFHPHSEPNMYTDALRPGHVFEAEGLEYKVVDLRS